MRQKINKIIIAKDGFPLETYQNSPFLNFLRKLLLSSHEECRDCYESRQAQKSSSVMQGGFTKSE